jgi:small nuclear ribonucleoprotein (snRNP)-like protein
MHDELLNTVLDDCEDASHQGRVVFCLCHVLIRV